MTAGVTTRQINEANRIRARFGRIRTRLVSDRLVIDVLGDSGTWPAPSVRVWLAPDGSVVAHARNPPVDGGDLAVLGAAVLNALGGWCTVSQVAVRLGQPTEAVRLAVAWLVLHGELIEHRDRPPRPLEYRRLGRPSCAT